MIDRSDSSDAGTSNTKWSRWAVLFSHRMWVALLMGFASGLPLLLTGSLLQAWFHDQGVDLGTIGLFALVGVPYTCKFLWAPLLDRYTPSLSWGRRRGWLIVIQLALIAAVASLGQTEPAQHPGVVALVALFVTFLSASQDIVIDAYRRESLADEEQGWGASLYVNGYRVGTLLASGGGLLLADVISFSQVYLVMAASLLVGVITTLWAVEPPTVLQQPKTLYAAVVNPFLDYFSRPDAWLILLFILLYKVGDMMASHMTIPFYLGIGFSKTEVGTVVKLFGFWATLSGGLIGGALLLHIGIYRALWIFGILQALSTAGFVALAMIGPHTLALTVVITLENVTGGMGTAAYVAFMASLTNRAFTATQYALLSSLMGVPRVIIAAPTGYLAAGMGWIYFFTFCTVMAIPGLLLLMRFRPWLVTPTVARPPTD